MITLEISQSEASMIVAALHLKTMHRDQILAAQYLALEKRISQALEGYDDKNKQARELQEP